MDSKDLIADYKRKGHFDKKRQQLYQSFKQSDEYAKLIDLVKEQITEEVKKNPQLLEQNKGKVSGLMTGKLYKNEDVSRIIEGVVKKCIDADELERGVKETLKE